MITGQLILERILIINGAFGIISPNKPRNRTKLYTDAALSLKDIQILFHTNEQAWIGILLKKDNMAT